MNAKQLGAMWLGIAIAVCVLSWPFWSYLYDNERMFIGCLMITLITGGAIVTLRDRP